MVLTLFQGKEGEGLLVPWPVRMSEVWYLGPLLPCQHAKEITRTRKRRKQVYCRFALGEIVLSRSFEGVIYLVV